MHPLNGAFENVGTRVPEAVAWKLPVELTKKVVGFALVIAGALGDVDTRVTVRVNFWVSVLLPPWR